MNDVIRSDFEPNQIDSSRGFELKNMGIDEINIFSQAQSSSCNPSLLINPQTVTIIQSYAKLDTNLNSKIENGSVQTIIDDRLTKASSSSSCNKDLHSFSDINPPTGYLDSKKNRKGDSLNLNSTPGTFAAISIPRIINENIADSLKDKSADDREVFSGQDMVAQDNQTENAEQSNRQAEIEPIQEIRFSPDNRLPDQSNIEERNQNMPNPEIGAEAHHIIEVQAPIIEDLQVLGRPEAKLFLNEVIGLSVFIFAFSLTFLLQKNPDNDYIWFFLLFDSYNFYQAIINFFTATKVLGERWIETNYALKMNIPTASWFTVIILYFKYVKVIPYASISCIPFVLSIVISLIFSRDNLRKKLWNNAIRTFYVIQFVLISLKIDGICAWDWKLILIPSWIYLSTKQFYCFQYLFSLIQLMRSQNPDSEAKTKKIGFFWCVLYNCFSFLGALVIIGIAQAYNSEANHDLGPLKQYAYFGIVISVLVCCYTVLARNYLIRFIILVKLIQICATGSQQAKIHPTKRIVVLEAENKEECFLMISPTYFMVLDKTTSSFKDRDSAKDIREKLQMIKLRKLKSNKFEKDLFTSPEENLKKNTGSLNNNSSKKNELSLNIRGNPLSLGHYTEEENKIQNFAYSLNDLDEGDKFKVDDGTPRASEEKPLCYICCTKEPDSILMNCGHGGICYDCVVPILKKKEECMQCRKKVDALFRIKPDPIFPKIYKGTELHKLLIKFE